MKGFANITVNLSLIWYLNFLNKKTSVSLLGEFPEENSILQLLSEEVNKKRT
jgi:hypothetical protein